MFRFLVLFIAIALVLWVVKTLAPKSRKNICPRCEGRGFYMVTRGREDCKNCGGSGELI